MLKIKSERIKAVRMNNLFKLTAFILFKNVYYLKSYFVYRLLSGTYAVGFATFL